MIVRLNFILLTFIMSLLCQIGYCWGHQVAKKPIKSYVYNKIYVVLRPMNIDNRQLSNLQRIHAIVRCDLHTKSKQLYLQTKLDIPLDAA